MSRPPIDCSRRRAVLSLEALEDRTLLSTAADTFMVKNIYPDHVPVQLLDFEGFVNGERPRTLEDRRHE